MAQTLFLFNPAPRPGEKTTRKTSGSTKTMAKKKPRTAAQKAATRKLVAMNRARRGGHSAKHRPARSRTRTRTVLMTSNPAPRPSRKHRSTKRAAHHAGRVLRYRRNPEARQSGGVVGLLKDAGMGAAGSSGVGYAVDKILAMLPATMPRSPELAAGVTLLGALGVSFLAAKIGKRAAGRAIAVGAITVAADRMARIYIAKANAASRGATTANPTVNGLELDYSMGEDMGEYVAMGEYDSMGVYVGQ
jgi:hypothetical protein